MDVSLFSRWPALREVRLTKPFERSTAVLQLCFELLGFSAAWYDHLRDAAFDMQDRGWLLQCLVSNDGSVTLDVDLSQTTCAQVYARLDAALVASVLSRG